MKNFKDLISNIDVLTDEAKASIQEHFEQAVNAKVKERTDLEIKRVTENIDKKHSEKLNQLLEAIDEDHSKKFQKALKTIDEDHSKKLKKLVAHYEKIIEKDSKVLKENLCDDISNFLNLYIEKLIPQQEIKKAVENKQALTILESIKKLVSVDERYINDEIKEALKDGKNKLDTLSSKLNQTLKENIDLKKELNKANASLMLEYKTVDMPTEKKNFVYKLLKDKSPEYIKENFNFVVEMFERDDESRHLVTEKTAYRRPRRVSDEIDTPTRPIVEKAETSAPKNEYLEALELLK